MARLRSLSIIAALIAVCIIAYAFDPVDGLFPYPRCWIKLLTGYDCPGCGSTRALHAMLHGHLAQAWAFNPFIFFAIPLILLALAADSPRHPRLRKYLLSPASAYIILSLTALYAILRNF